MSLYPLSSTIGDSSSTSESIGGASLVRQTPLSPILNGEANQYDREIDKCHMSNAFVWSLGFCQSPYVGLYFSQEGGSGALH